MQLPFARHEPRNGAVQSNVRAAATTPEGDPRGLQFTPQRSPDPWPDTASQGPPQRVIVPWNPDPSRISAEPTHVPSAKFAASMHPQDSPSPARHPASTNSFPTRGRTLFFPGLGVPHSRRLSSDTLKQPSTTKTPARRASSISTPLPPGSHSIFLVSPTAGGRSARPQGALLPPKYTDNRTHTIIPWPPERTPTSFVPGACSFNTPTQCKHCHTPLSFPSKAPRLPYTSCCKCALVAFISPRTILPQSDPHARLDPEGITPPLSAVQQPILCVDDYRWSAVRHSPVSPNTISLLRYEQVIASIPLRQARYWRSLILNSLPKLSLSFRVNEVDVAAHMLAIFLNTHPHDQPQPPTEQFRGDQHQFMSANHLLEPGFLRTACLPKALGDVFFADPAVSAYADIRDFKSPLRAVFGRTNLRSHPASSFMFNGVVCGFPTGGHPPQRFRQTRVDHSALAADPRLVEQENVEIAAGAVIDASDWPSSVPIRLAPWFGVEKNGKIKGVCDLSWGTDSLNHSTRRAPLLPARLADWNRVALRILYLAEQCPGREIHLAKLDVRRAFRQVPLPLRDFWKAAHIFQGKRYVHTRLTLGATCSVDSMSVGISAIQDLAALEGIFAESYVDDQLIVSYADTIAADIAFVRSLWIKAGWPFNDDKFAAEGFPTPVKDFLGILIDTKNFTASITEKRQASLSKLLKEWLEPDFRPTLKRTQVLAGTLNFVASVIPMGKTFLKRLYTSEDANLPSLSTTLRADILWWQAAVTNFNGTASFAPLAASAPTIHIATDASGSGWGAVRPDTCEFASGLWSPRERHHSSTAHWEAAAIVFACELWGPQATGGLLVVHTDSMASVAVLSRYVAHDTRMYALLRHAVRLQILHQFRLVTPHIAGSLNSLADFASRHNALPPTHSSWTKLQLAPLARTIGGVLRTDSPKLLNPVAAPTALPPITSVGTASPTSSTPKRILPWILWNRLRWTNPDKVVFSTSYNGWQTTSHTSPGHLSAATPPPLQRKSKDAMATTGSAVPFATVSLSAMASKNAKPSASASQPTRTSSGPSDQTTPSAKQHVLASSLVSTPSSASPSSPPTAQRPHRQSTLSSAKMSAGQPPTKRISSGTNASNQTVSTQAQKHLGPHARVTHTAPSVPCVHISHGSTHTSRHTTHSSSIQVAPSSQGTTSVKRSSNTRATSPAAKSQRTASELAVLLKWRTTASPGRTSSPEPAGAPSTASKWQPCTHNSA